MQRVDGNKHYQMEVSDHVTTATLCTLVQENWFTKFHFLTKYWSKDITETEHVNIKFCIISK